MVCAGCKNLDTKKKVDGSVSGTKYYCKKNKKYISGSMEVCPKFAKSYRDTDTYNKIYEEGEKWDDDNTSPFAYFIIAIILLIVLALVYLFNPELY